MIPYRNASVDRWQRKTQLATGAAAVKGRFQAFNQVKLSALRFMFRVFDFCEVLLSVD